VSYNSSDALRACVEPLAGVPGVSVVVVDNASADASLATLSDLAVETVQLTTNNGFAHGCNVGWKLASEPFVLFLNPDATIDPESLGRLVGVLEADPQVGLVAPRIAEPDGALHHSLRRFPRLRSTYAQALFLHRLFPRASWTDEMIRTEETYAEPGSPDWVSGACMLLRRSALEELGGLDEGFFLYCEDTDLCLRMWEAGHAVRFEPRAEIHHVGGASSGAGETQPIVARSRVLYARKHRGRRVTRLEALGVALGEATHVVAAARRPASRRGHARALRAAVRSA
jgi:hypothetical protein